MAILLMAKWANSRRCFLAVKIKSGVRNISHCAIKVMRRRWLSLRLAMRGKNLRVAKVVATARIVVSTRMTDRSLRLQGAACKLFDMR